MIFYDISIHGDFEGNTCLKVNFKGDLRKDSADADYITDIAHELKSALEKLNKIRMATNLEKTDETE